MIYGRKNEIDLLNKVLESNQAELIAIYGRRRIGKTYLIDQFFKDKGLYFCQTGSQNSEVSIQLKNFITVYSDVFCRGLQEEIPSNWMDAFEKLRKQIENIKTTRKIILFFDELPWLASPKSGFLQALEYYWNRYFSKKNNVIMIICGSAASWMIKKVINDKGGLHGRVTRQIRLTPFTLSETEEYLKSKNISLGKKQIAELYMAIGGVAAYLNQVEPGLSSSQLINKICFSPQGFLFKEFNKLYGSLFKKHERHVSIINSLSKKRSGLKYDQLIKASDLPSGGTTTDIVNELVESGFISKIPTFDKGVQDVVYKLTDEYSLFYLSWMKNFPDSSLRGINENYWMNKYQTTSWKSWVGFSFESLCIKHSPEIIRALGLSGIHTETSTWSNKNQSDGTQIDLVINRADQCINLCEIKFYNTEYVMNKIEAENLLKKKQIFQKITQTKKTVFTTLITTYGAKKNKHYLGAVDNQLVLEDLF